MSTAADFASGSGSGFSRTALYAAAAADGVTNRRYTDGAAMLFCYYSYGGIVGYRVYITLHYCHAGCSVVDSVYVLLYMQLLPMLPSCGTVTYFV